MSEFESLNEIKQELIRRLPPAAEISEVSFEGPFLVVYSRNAEELLNDGSLVKGLAKTFRKRIVIRSDPGVRMEAKEAESKIKEIVPLEADISTISFDETLGEVCVEAKKPGLVIGRSGSTLREITKQTAWRPTVVRTPPIQSNLITNIRNIINSGSSARKKILVDIGTRIHRPTISSGDWVRITALGGASEVGRSCFLLETAESKVLVDVGVNVGSSSPELMFPFLNIPEFDMGTLDAVVITHAHLDHSGFLPFLFKYGYRGPVYCNDATLSLMTLLQRDYLAVAENEGKIRPYHQRDIKRMILHTIPRRYGEVTDLSPDIKLTMTPAGHILGSSIVHCHVGDGRYNLAIANDFKFTRSRLLDPANYKFPRLECMIMESTYGASRDIMPSRRESERQLANIINQTIRRGGKVLIPSLAVGRAQELLVVIDTYIRTKRLTEVPVFLDGLISEATAIHTCHPEYLSSELQDAIFNAGHNPFLSEFFVKVDHRSMRDELIEGDPCVILATSGMLTGGSSVEYFHKLAEDPKNSIVFVSYQAERTLGKRVSSGIKEIRAFKEGRMRVTHVNMDVHTVEGFSGHSDRKELMNYVRRIQPRPERVILVHGRRQKELSLGTSLQRHYKNLTVSLPQNLETIRLV